jgi:hypothetical protein
MFFVLAADERGWTQIFFQSVRLEHDALQAAYPGKYLRPSAFIGGQNLDAYGLTVVT